MMLAFFQTTSGDIQRDSVHLQYSAIFVYLPRTMIKITALQVHSLRSFEDRFLLRPHWRTSEDGSLEAKTPPSHLTAEGHSSRGEAPILKTG
jgi:hypothetical protein